MSYLMQQMAAFLLGTAALFFALGWYLARWRGRALLQEMDDAWSVKHRAVLQSFDKIRTENENALSLSLTADNLIESERSRAERAGEEADRLRERISELEDELRRRPQAEEGDDLKKIRGIGLVLEKKLNSLGVRYYRQIALWTEEDVKRFAEQLAGFPDRIARDRWVERAGEEHQAKYGETLARVAVNAG